MGNDHCRKWRGEAKRLGGLEIDDQLKLRRLQHRQVGGLLALENPASVDADLTVRIRGAGSVAHQAAGLGVLAQLINRRNFVACSKSRQSIAGEKEMRTTSDDQYACSLPNSGRECRFEVPFTPNRRKPDRYPNTTCRCLQLLHLKLHRVTGRVSEDSDRGSLRNQIA